MTIPQDISSASFPFAAGIAAGLAAAAHFPPGSLYAWGMAAAWGLIAAGAMTGRTRRMWAMAAMFAAAGIFCALTWRLGTGGAPSGRAFEGGTAGVWTLAQRASDAMRAAVDGIPYPSQETGPLVKALTTGDRSSLSRDTVEVFRKAGAAHLLALSGMHLGIIYMIIRWLLTPLGNSPHARKVKYVITVTLCGFYALATGAGASIVRAFLFIFLTETARITLRAVRPVKIWCGALTLQLSLNPAAALSAGFQLSYLAMAGIILVFPVLRDWYPSEGMRSDRLNLPRRIWEGAALAISCQLFTAPLSWALFGTFPKYFLLTNLLAMPLTTALMVVSVGTIVLSIMGICPYMMTAANDALCRCLIDILSIISSI